jgi:hypothetical protein
MPQLFLLCFLFGMPLYANDCEDAQEKVGITLRGAMIGIAAVAGALAIWRWDRNERGVDFQEFGKAVKARSMKDFKTPEEFKKWLLALDVKLTTFVNIEAGGSTTFLNPSFYLYDVNQRTRGGLVSLGEKLGFAKEAWNSPSAFASLSIGVNALSHPLELDEYNRKTNALLAEAFAYEFRTHGNHDQSVREFFNQIMREFEPKQTTINDLDVKMYNVKAGQ